MRGPVALLAVAMIAGCAAAGIGDVVGEPSGHSDPVEHFLEVCAAIAPAPPTSLDAESGWIERERPRAPTDSSAILDRIWQKEGGERSDTFWIAEWRTDAPPAEEAYLSYSCTVSFNGSSFEQIDSRLRAAGFDHMVVEYPWGGRTVGAPRTQDSRWSGESTLATYVGNDSFCEVRLHHGERDPIGAPCTDCRQTVLMCHVDSVNLPMEQRREWERRRGI